MGGPPQPNSSGDNSGPPEPNSKASDDQEWRRSEEEVADIIDGLTQPMSGGLYFMKGDVKSDEILFEVKSTEKSGRYISKEVFEKIYSEAKQESRIPVFVMYFLNTDDHHCFIPTRYLDEFDEINCTFNQKDSISNDGKTFSEDWLESYNEFETFKFDNIQTPAPKSWAKISFDILNKIEKINS